MGVTIGILGGAFDPPHNGHLALAEGARRELGLEGLRVHVVADPGHRAVHASADDRLMLTRAAFPGEDVRLEPHAYTVDALAADPPGDAVFVVGADEGRAFPTWKDPEGVLRHVRLAVGTRHGYDETDLQRRYGDDRVRCFHIESPPISSSTVRARVARGEPVDALVPAGVAALIRELGLYVRETGLHSE
jgi:nicotinate-nucleotide adenylyltransferase